MLRSVGINNKFPAMINEITIKKSPVVLLWKFAVVEIIALLLYLGAALLGYAKYELYTQLSFSNILSYQVARILFLYGAQFALTVYVFLSWFYDYYVIRPGSVTFARGIFLRRADVLQVDNATTFSVSSLPMGVVGLGMLGMFMMMSLIFDS